MNTSLKLIIQDLDPFGTLSEQDLDALTEHASIVEYSPGGEVYIEGDDDEYANIVLDGEADRFLQRRRVGSSAPGAGAPLRPTDGAGPKTHTLVAKTRLKVLRLLRRDLDRAIAASIPGANVNALSVSEIHTDDSDDWMTRFLRSALFNNQTAADIERVLSRMVQIDECAGAEVIRQGDPPGYFYVIESGHCEVVRRPSPDRAEVQLAVLGPGDTFGEEAIVGSEPRNATVRMLDDGTLMRLDQDDFLSLLVRPMVHGVSRAQAFRMVELGVVWVDTRSREAYRANGFAGALSIPHEVIRLGCGKLDLHKTYVVCHDDTEMSRLGSLLIALAGYTVHYLDESMNDMTTTTPARTTDNEVEIEGHEHGAGDGSAAIPPVPGRAGPGSHAQAEPAMSAVPQRDDVPRCAETPLPREQYADTMVGIELADLIDELGERHEGLRQGASSGAAERAPIETSSEPTLAGAAGTAAGAQDVSTPEPVVVDGGSCEPTEEELRRILAATDLRVREYVRRTVEAHRTRFEQQLEERVAEVRRSASLVLAERTRVLRQRYEIICAEKEQALRRDYERLISLAGKMSHQKAEIQRKRKDLEQKLRDADRLYRDVAQIGDALIHDIGEIEEIEPARTLTLQRH